MEFLSKVELGVFFKRNFYQGVEDSVGWDKGVCLVESGPKSVGAAGPGSY